MAADLSDGLRAYGAKQAHLWMALGMKFATMWHKPLMKSGGIVDNWPVEYQLTLDEDAVGEGEAAGVEGEAAGVDEVRASSPLHFMTMD